MHSNIGRGIRLLHTSEQKRKLPQLILNYLEPRYLVSIRDGTGTYVGSTNFGSGGGPGIPFMVFPGEMMIVR
jgi:hypothetical protein